MSGLSFLLPGFAAAFLGSTTITPGRFNPWGTFIAVYFLVTGITGLAIMGVQTWVQSVFYGGGSDHRRLGLADRQEASRACGADV